MKNTKILITGGSKSSRLSLANTLADGFKAQGVVAGVTDLEQYDAIISISIPSNIQTAIFVAGHEGKRFVGIYERLIQGSQDKLTFVHIEIK